MIIHPSINKSTDFFYPNQTVQKIYIPRISLIVRRNQRVCDQLLSYLSRLTLSYTHLQTLFVSGLTQQHSMPSNWHYPLPSPLTTYYCTQCTVMYPSLLYVDPIVYTPQSCVKYSVLLTQEKHSDVSRRYRGLNLPLRLSGPDGPRRSRSAHHQIISYQIEFCQIKLYRFSTKPEERMDPI